MNQKFVHLHLHTEYSPQDAPVAIDKLVPYAKKMGYESLAITDHGTVGSWVKFALACKKHGMRPIFGMEGYFVPDVTTRSGTRSDNNHILLLAKNDEGIKSLFRLSERAWREGYYYDPRMDWAMLEQHGEGLVCTSACIGGIAPSSYRRLREKGKEKEGLTLAREHLSRFRDIFGDDFYVEVQYHCLEIEFHTYQAMARLAAELGIKVVGTNDVHYLRRDDHDTQEALMALCMQKCMKDPKRIRHEQRQFFLKSPEEMIDVFGGAERQAVLSTLEISDKCDANLRFGRTQLPAVDIPEPYEDSFAYFEHLAWEGLRALGKDDDPAYRTRLEEEIRVVRRIKDRPEKPMRFDHYFLCVTDYVGWAKRNGVRVGVGRGSGAGSLVLYCMGITGIDPIKHDLLFERFLNEERMEMPDIDVDFDKVKISRVFEYIWGKYGDDYCARVGTASVFHVASALKSSFKVYDPMGSYELRAKSKSKNMNSRSMYRGSRRQLRSNRFVDPTFEEANRITRMLPKDPNSGRPSTKCTFDKGEAERGDKIYIYEHRDMLDMRKKYKRIFEFAESIEGQISSRGIHAAGVLITSDPAVEVFPQQRCGKGTSIGTAFTMSEVEMLGGVKFDLLSLKGLSAIDQALKAIKMAHGKDVQIDDLDINDPKVIDVFRKGDTIGIFQFENEGMRKFLMALKPDSFDEIVAANAIYRPGPMQYKDDYCDRKHGRSKVSYYVPMLEPILKPTYGIMVYQEQVMRITRVLAGFTGIEADKVRKAMGKKKKNVLDEMHDKFLRGCKKLGTCDHKLAEHIWRDMENFAAYAFNKSHAVAYSFIAYQCAFLKHYYPAEFMAAQISVEGWDGAYETVKKYERHAAAMGIAIDSLHVNESRADYEVRWVKGKIRLRRGFKGIDGLGNHAYSDILQGQPYRDMFDYCSRAKGASKKDVVRRLIDAGAFDWLLPSIGDSLGRPVTREDLEREYEDKNKRASAERREKGARKEEKNGIGMVFGFNDKKNEFALDL